MSIENVVLISRERRCLAAKLIQRVDNLHSMAPDYTHVALSITAITKQKQTRFKTQNQQATNRARARAKKPSNEIMMCHDVNDMDLALEWIVISPFYKFKKRRLYRPHPCRSYSPCSTSPNGHSIASTSNSHVVPIGFGRLKQKPSSPWCRPCRPDPFVTSWRAGSGIGQSRRCSARH